MKVLQNVEMVADETGLYVSVDGERIARRGEPGTAQAMTWVPLVAGWEVVSGPKHEYIEIKYEGEIAVPSLALDGKPGTIQ